MNIKNKFLKRFLSGFLAVAMLLSLASVTTFAKKAALSGSLTDVAAFKMKASGEMESLEKTYTITVEGIVDEPISLSSPDCEVTDSEGNSTEISLQESLYYNKNGTFINVSYLQLLQNENKFDVQLYDTNGLLTDGTPVLITEHEEESLLSLKLHGLQTTTKDGNIVDCKVISASPFVYSQAGLEGQIFSLAEITGSDEFYYATTATPTAADLQSCSEVKIVNDDESFVLAPVDNEGKPVKNAELFMVRDRLYQFDLQINSMVNEHSEDNGDAFLWKGTTWYDSADKIFDNEAGYPEYTVEAGATDVVPVEATITGRIGDTFTPASLEQTMIYAATGEKRAFTTDWFNVGKSPTDRENEEGTRGATYFINDYVRLNSYVDKVNFFEIYKDASGNPAVRMKMPNNSSYINLTETNGKYEEADLYVARPAVARIKYAEIHERKHKQPTHVQLRIPTNIMVDLNGEYYNGAFLFKEAIINAEHRTEEGIITLLDNKLVVRSEEGTPSAQQEAPMASFVVDETTYYIPSTDVFDDKKVVVNITYSLTGTLTPISGNGEPIVYTDDNPYTHTATLTSRQLQQAYYGCPEQAGYDVILDVNYDMQMDMSTGDKVYLTKVWKDQNNVYGVRPDSIRVKLQRSKDGINWEDFKNNTVKMSGIDTASVWTEEILGLETYFDESGKECQYQYKIVEETDSINAIGDDVEYKSVIAEDGLTITNTIIPAKTTVMGFKTWLDSDGTVLEEEYLPESLTVALYQNDKFYEIETITANDNWAFTFTNLPLYTGRERNTYKVYEVNEQGKVVTTGDEIILDNVAYTADITETDMGFRITNKRTVPAPVEVAFTTYKSVTGEDAPLIDVLNGRFEFTLEAVSDNAANLLPDVTTVANIQDTVAFDSISFTEEGTYIYKITETAVKDDDHKWNQSIEEIEVTVIVTKDKSTNKLVAEVTYSGENGADDNVFVNEYVKPTPIDLVVDVEKTLTDAPLTDGQFSFILTPVNQAPGEIQKVTNAADGTVTFDNITFEAEGTYSYIIREELGEDGNFIYDEDIYTVTVTVEKNSDNSAYIITEKTVVKNTETYEEETLLFNNSRRQPAEVQITATKLLDNEPSAKEFSFVLEGIDSNGNSVRQEIKNDDSGIITFDKLYFDRADIYTYTISEVVVAEDNSIIYDEVVYEALIEVKIPENDNSNPYIASVTYNKAGESVNELEFTNKTRKPVTVALAASKTMDGNVPDSNEFWFSLEGDTLSEAQICSTDKNGNVVFEEMTYDEVGTYNYTITEIPGTKEHIIYDDSVYDVTVEVTAPLFSDSYKAKVTYSKDGKKVEKAAFENVTRESAVVELTASKTLDDKAAKKGQFEFVLKSEDGKIIQTVENGRKGKIVFDELRFDHTGIYNYVISEVNTENENIIYDDSVYNVEIIVTYNIESDDPFQTDISYKKDGETVEEIIFVNETVKEEPPVEDEEPPVEDEEPPVEDTPPAKEIIEIVKTGDTSSPFFFGLVGVFSLMVFVMVVMLKKRKLF